jgi:protein-S-isoprenylcysteine O-methyltransferase Ste14
MEPGYRSILVAVVVGGTLLVLLPGYLLESQGGPGVAAPPLAVLGAVLALAFWSVRELAETGRGTPNPLDPPRELVTTGPYQYVRNPMAVGFLALLLGEAAWFASTALLVYAAIAFCAIHLLVVLHEEPAHRRRFGAAFDAYGRQVARWTPRRRPR